MAIIAALVTLVTTGAKGCGDTGSSNAKPNRLVSVTLETRGSAFRQQIRYKIVPKGKAPSEVGWDLNTPFVGKHYKQTVFLSNEEAVIFHAINHDEQGTHVRCVIHAFKQKKADHADPSVASCQYIARTTPLENQLIH